MIWSRACRHTARYNRISRRQWKDGMISEFEVRSSKANALSPALGIFNVSEEGRVVLPLFCKCIPALEQSLLHTNCSAVLDCRLCLKETIQNGVIRCLLRQNILNLLENGLHCLSQSRHRFWIRNQAAYVQSMLCRIHRGVDGTELWYIISKDSVWDPVLTWKKCTKFTSQSRSQAAYFFLPNGRRSKSYWAG